MAYFWEALILYLNPWHLVRSKLTSSESTGTFHGAVTKPMAQCCGQCLSIECASSFASSTRDRFSSYSCAAFSKGNLLDLISQVIPQRDASTLFCLNAHGVYEFDILGAEENSLPAEIHAMISARDSMVERFPWQI
jgi:hypothetical protein